MEAEERPVKIRKLEGDTERAVETAESLNGDASSESDAEAASLPHNHHDSTHADAPLSKNQLKKLKRQQQWEAGREDRKKKRKEQIKARKERKRAAEAEALQQKPPDVLSVQKPGHPRPTLLPLTIVFDCSYDDLMLDKEMKSLASQLTRCYSDNHKARFRTHMAVSSFTGKLRERFDTVLDKNYRNWKGVRFFDEDFCHVAPLATEWMRAERGGRLVGRFAEHSEKELDAVKEAGETIYLSSDSGEVLTELRPYSTYIIGGLVDRNRHKGVCHRRAMDAGFRTAKLPIGQFLEMNSRSVLATNHVAEIMLKWLECGDWGEAFMQVIPKRKGGVLRGVQAGGGDEVREDQDDELEVGGEDGSRDEPTEELQTQTVQDSRDEPAEELQTCE